MHNTFQSLSDNCAVEGCSNNIEGRGCLILTYEKFRRNFIFTWKTPNWKKFHSNFLLWKEMKISVENCPLTTSMLHFPWERSSSALKLYMVITGNAHGLYYILSHCSLATSFYVQREYLHSFSFVWDF